MTVDDFDGCRQAAVAAHLGLFAKHGLRVELRREIGWATIREKIIYGELDAAHAPAPMLWCALYLPDLALQVFTRGDTDDTPLAVLGPRPRQRVAGACPAATA